MTDRGRRGEVPSPAPSIPTGPSADRYTTTAEPPATTDPLATKLAVKIDSIRRKSGQVPMVRDGRLDRVARDIAISTGASEVPSFDATVALFAHYGIVEPDPGLILKQGDDGAETSAVADLARELAGNSDSHTWRRMGIGVKRTPGHWMAVLVFHGKNLDLDPVPRRIPSQGHATIAGRIRAMFHAPEVLFTPPRGAVRRLATATQQGTFTARLDCDEGDGPYQVEISAEDARGPTVLANFPVYCGVAPPALVLAKSAPLSSVTDPALAERQMLDAMDRDRLANGLPVLVRDPRLARMARRYSREMAETGQVAHYSRRTGTVVDRVHAAGISPEPTCIAENVSSALSAADAERGFMASPGHRDNILNRALTHVGVGVAAGREEGGTVPLFFTQVFAGFSQ